VNTLPPPPPPAMLLDPDEITLVTDQERRCLFVSIPGYGRLTPDQLIACLEARDALGQARADAAGLELKCAIYLAAGKDLQDVAEEALARVQELEQELAALKARMPVLEAAAGCEGGSR